MATDEPLMASLIRYLTLVVLQPMAHKEVRECHRSAPSAAECDRERPSAAECRRVRLSATECD